MSSGIIVGASHQYEAILAFWWYHVQEHNPRLPLAFIDFGMSEETRKWCERRGELIIAKERLLLKEPSSFYKNTWATLVPKNLEKIRYEWYQKVIAFSLSPFEKTLWLDADCEVRENLEPLFSLLHQKEEVALVQDLQKNIEKAKSLNLLLKEERYFNSGVVLFQKSSKWLEKFVQKAKEQNELFLSDQCVLSRTLFENNVPIVELDSTYNWMDMSQENPKAKINHWTCPQGKLHIYQMLQALLNFPLTRNLILS